jgi:cysteine desulfurase/selenocysteine lyase
MVFIRNDIGTIVDQNELLCELVNIGVQPIMTFFNIPGTIRYASFAFANTKKIDYLVLNLQKAIKC